MKHIFLALILVLSAPAANATYTCEGVVEDVVLSPDGMISGNFGPLKWVYLCSVRAQYHSVAPDACKSIYALLLTASAGRRKVTFWFNDGLTCTTHPSWAALTGWYYGPALNKDAL